ncbi:MAG: hypothetical protein R3182_13940, partial [Draconibacterium sp.]|nr:hypothetical protein [Draconibacterium sp.]
LLMMALFFAFCLGSARSYYYAGTGQASDFDEFSAVIFHFSRSFVVKISCKNWNGKEDSFFQ